MTASRAWLAVFFAIALLGGCVGVPPEMEADLVPPDGSRPNNFGRMEGEAVHPDRPTIAAVTTRGAR
jgi:hypothetical protein